MKAKYTLLTLAGLLILIILSLNFFQKTNMDSQAKHSMDLSNPSFPVGETVTYRGQAVNKEYGAVLVYTGSMKDYNFLIEGLGLWPEEQLGRGVVVTGLLTEASGEADYMLKNVKTEIDPHPLN